MFNLRKIHCHIRDIVLQVVPRIYETESEAQNQTDYHSTNHIGIPIVSTKTVFVIRMNKKN